MNAVVALPPPPFARHAAPALAARQAPARNGVGFFLFVLANAVLFIRPAEIVQGLVGWNIYEFVILACLAASLSAVLEQFTPKALEERPITVCVLGLLLAVALASLTRLNLEQLGVASFEFFKIVIYYVLFVGLVDSPARLRTFLFWMLLFTTVAVGLTVLEYHDLVLLPNTGPIHEFTQDKATGQEVVIKRLSGSGMVADPNEMGVLIALSFPLALYWLFDRRSGILRLLWAGPLFLFLYALGLTQSRGALLALLGGVAVVLVARFGWRVALLVGAAVVPALLLFMAGRQTEISTGEGTSQERIQSWSDGIMLLREAPFGVGKDEYAKHIGIVAHNTYLHYFVELGVFGGLLFLGAYYLAVSRLFRLGEKRKRVILDPEMGRLYPYVFGAVASYAVGMVSLSLCYILPTYTVLALATVYGRTAVAQPPLPATRFDLGLLGRLVAVAVAGFLAMYLFVRLFVVH